MRLGHDGTNNIILLGTPATAWRYPKVVVTDFYAPQTGRQDGWTIDVQDNETGFTDRVAPTIHTYVDAAGNLGVGTVNPVARLDIRGDGDVGVITSSNAAD